MEFNPPDAWYSKDKRLLKILVNIDNEKLSDEASASKAFYQVSDLYGLPKFPDDVDEDEEGWEDTKPRSVFEEVAVIRYMFPDELPRGLIMFALYNVKNKICIPFDEVAATHYGTHDDIPEIYFLYFYGKDADARLMVGDEKDSAKIAGTFHVKKVARTMYD